MSVPNIVFLDTSVLAGQEYNFSSTAIETFVEVARKRGVTLLLPDPTEREITTQIKERSEEALHALDTARRKAPFLAKWKHFPQRPAGNGRTWEVHDVAMREWRKFLSLLTVARLGYEGIDIADVMNWYQSASAPFGRGKKRKEFPDAFAVAALVVYAIRNNVHIGVVSQDGDFREACERFPELLYFQTLPQLTELLVADAETIAAIRGVVESNLSVIEEKVLEASKDIAFYVFSDKFELDDSEIEQVSLDKVNVVAIGGDQCTLTFEAEIRSRHRVRWQEWADDQGLEHLEADVTNRASVSGTAKVELDVAAKSIKRTVYIDIDEPEIEVTDAPIDW